MNKRRKISLSLALIIIFSFLTACGGNKSIEEKLIDGGIWLAQGKWSSYLMVFTPEGKVLYGGDFQAIFELVRLKVIMLQSMLFLFQKMGTPFF
jgi:hypothetical protein